MAEPSASRRRGLGGRPVVSALVTSVVLLLLAGGVLVWTSLSSSAGVAAGDVLLEAAVSPGPDPFTDSLVVGNPPGTKSQTVFRDIGASIPTVAGETEALYGGSRNEKVCDKQKLIDFLNANPDKAAAWADVLGIQPPQVAEYVGKLTPLQLRTDTRVTNHGFSNGHATPRQAVLQAGTAVLVDELGRPRVKCGCGNPLAEPVALSGASRFNGEPWPDFNDGGLVAVTAASRLIDRFVVVDLRTGDSFYRARGTAGETDEPTNEPVPTLVPTTSPPTPTTVACPAGQHPAGAACVPDAPTCPRGQHVVGSGCVPDEIVCLAGQHRAGAGCVPDQVCPAGQHPSGSSCAPDSVSCPSGQHPSGATCVPNSTGPTDVSCPPGQHRSGSQCVPNTTTTRPTTTTAKKPSPSPSSQVG